jgi:plastocyanin
MPSRLLISAFCALVALGSPAAAQAKDLFGTVNPDFTITLRDDQGRSVTQLDPGEYRIVVEDRSDFHNFHLSGPGVNVATDIEAIETVTWNVTLVEGRYTFVCDPHATDMRGALVVGNPPPPPAPPKRQRLVATVGPGATISLTMNGRRVRMLTTGLYAIVVRDRSRARNFHVIGPGLNRKTAVARMGTFTWNVTLRAGNYRFVSDPQARRLRGTFMVH